MTASSNNGPDQGLGIGIAVQVAGRANEFRHAGILQRSPERRIIGREYSFALEPVAQSHHERLHFRTADLAGRPELLVGLAHPIKFGERVRTFLSEPRNELVLLLLDQVLPPRGTFRLASSRLVDLF